MPSPKTSKPKRGRPSLGGRQRPILKTSVAKDTLEGLRSAGGHVGRVVDDAWTAYSITRDAAARAGVPHNRYLLGMVAAK